MLRVNAGVPNAPQLHADQEAVVVEDDPDARRLVATCLRRLGLRVHEAASGAEAQVLLERAIPDLICLDLRLPDASGLECIRRIQAAKPELPIVVLTGHDDERLALDALQEGAQDYLVKAEVAGADEYMTKPFRADVLVDSVRELIALSAVAPS